MVRLERRACAPSLPPLLVAGAAVLAGLPWHAANAANWFAEAGLAGRVTYTTNSQLSATGDGQSDVIVDLTPSIVVRGQGGRLRMSGTAALSGVTYVNGTQSSGFTPTAAFTANLEAIERWLYFDAGLTAAQTAENSFAPRPEGSSTVNRRTTTQARLSPYIDRPLPNDMRLRVRSDSTWTRESGLDGAADESYSARYSLLFEQAPRPFGWALEGERTETEFKDGTTPTPDIDVARLRLRYAFGGQWVVGARAGYERSDLFVADSRERTFFGAELSWRPTERTQLEGFWEDRAFGSGWQTSFNHRMPRLAWSFSFSRDLTSSAAPLLTLPAGGDVAALLDATLQTRIQDPIERARAVEDIIARQGLPRTLAGPFNLFSDRILLRRSRSGTVTWTTPRGSVAFNVFDRRDEVPSGDEFALLPGPTAGTASQLGAGLRIGHRFTELSTLSGGVSWSRTRDLSSAGEPGSRQWTYSLQLDHRLGARTSAFAGARYLEFDSELQNSSRETAVFAGLSHRF